MSRAHRHHSRHSLSLRAGAAVLALVMFVLTVASTRCTVVAGGGSVATSPMAAMAGMDHDAPAAPDARHPTPRRAPLDCALASLCTMPVVTPVPDAPTVAVAVAVDRARAEGPLLRLTESNRAPEPRPPRS